MSIPGDLLAGEQALSEARSVNRSIPPTERTRGVMGRESGGEIETIMISGPKAQQGMRFYIKAERTGKSS